MKYCLLALTIIAFGCDSSSSQDTAVGSMGPMQPPTQMEPTSPAQPTPSQTPGRESPTPTPSQDMRPEARVTPSHWGEAQTADLRTPVEPVEPGRARRRMNLDQLEAAFLHVSDGLNWTERRNNQDVSLFQTLSATLGKPDFIQVTNEVLEPTALFQKFLDDASRQVCQKMIERDEGLRDGVTILLPRDREELSPEERVQALVKRFHNRILSSESRDLAQWMWFLDTALRVTDTRAEAWHAMCVALFTHPDFYSY
ncbi:MAG: hypothetical protein ACON3Z_04800 [Bradymonadia bacterium]